MSVLISAQGLSLGLVALGAGRNAAGLADLNLEKRLRYVSMVTMGSDLWPGCLADRLLTGLVQPQINP
jgi:hypothetical protein